MVCHPWSGEINLVRHFFFVSVLIENDIQLVTMHSCTLGLDYCMRLSYIYVCSTILTHSQLRRSFFSPLHVHLSLSVML